MSLPDFYRYIAIFSFERDGIHVTFPDLPGCISFGANEEEASKNAETALKLHIYGMERDRDEIPAASTIRDLVENEDLLSNETFMMINVFMPSFREKQNRRVVKKTLTVPYWLNAEAERYGINLSSLLQNALKKELNIV